MARPRVTTPTGARPPTTELGTSGGPYSWGRGTLGMGPSWNMFVDTYEYVPDLIWPRSCMAGGTFDQMRTDSQMAALFFGVTMPIRRYKWMIDPNGADDSIVKHIADDFNLDILGEDPRPRGRSRNRFSHDQHLKEAMLALIYGHMYFEPVGWIGTAEKPPADGLWHLKKMAARMPSTIEWISVATDGGLVSIKQYAKEAKEIPVDRLVAYVWEGEGGNWVGRSMFRDCYKNWLIKDRLLRIDAINHERAGGVPIPEAPPDATDDEIRELAEMAIRFRIGEDAGGALPSGAKWQMAQPQRGSAPVMDSVRYHDEAMARRFLMMVAMLAQGGTTLGSYALGEVFSDFFSLGQEAIANWYRDVMNEYMIEDEVDWNWGEKTEQVPLLTYQKDYDEDLPMADLVQMVDKRLITVDPDLEDALRKRYNLPKRAPGNPGPDPNPPVPAPFDPSGGAKPPPKPKPSTTTPSGAEKQTTKTATSYEDWEERGRQAFRYWDRVPAQPSPPGAESGEGEASLAAPSELASPNLDT